MAKRTKHLHEKLGISFRELGALLGTRELLRRGLLEVDRKYAGFEPNKHKFNMRCGMVEGDCGTVGCIGGTMYLLMNNKANFARPYYYDPMGYVDSVKGALHELFYPPFIARDDGRTATVRQAIKAIDNYLAGSKKPWEGIEVK